MAFDYRSHHKRNSFFFHLKWKTTGSFRCNPFVIKGTVCVSVCSFPPPDDRESMSDVSIINQTDSNSKEQIARKRWFIARLTDPFMSFLSLQLKASDFPKNLDKIQKELAQTKHDYWLLFFANFLCPRLGVTTSVSISLNSFIVFSSNGSFLFSLPRFPIVTAYKNIPRHWFYT